MFRCFIMSLSDRWTCLDILLYLCLIEGCVYVLLSFESDRGMCLDNNNNNNNGYF